MPPLFNYIQCLWCLSNLLEISPENKNDIIEKGILEKAKKNYQISKNVESLKNLTLIIFQLTKSRPSPSFDKVKYFTYLNECFFKS